MRVIRHVAQSNEGLVGLVGAVGSFVGLAAAATGAFRAGHSSAALLLTSAALGIPVLLAMVFMDEAP